MRRPKASPRTVLTLFFTLIIFAILAITMLVVGFVVFLLSQINPSLITNTPNLVLPFITVGITSVVVGTIIGAAMSRIPVGPINKLIEGMNRLKNGDYEVKIHLRFPRIGNELSDSFNMLSSELKNTEMLRSDFVNNFSHEFKTPLVSIRGFAKLLQKDNISEEKRKEYLNIIVEESTRLADMATEVLNLTKIENQNILVDVSDFNVSEQIRNCVLLLEKKWEKKNLSILVDFEEYNVNGNEEMLKQIWINVIDNAIKFSVERGEIKVSIEKKEHALVVSISNKGETICNQDKKRIFQKYYQGDTSHASEGTGIGLALVKSIIELHSGSISVESEHGETTFFITLPQFKSGRNRYNK